MCCSRQSHPKGSKDIFVIWFVIITVVVITRIIKWSEGSFLLLFFNCFCCGCYSFCKWNQISRFRWSFSARWWSSWFSTLFKENEVNPRKWVIFESEFASSQSKAFKFVFLDAYFKPYAIDVTDRYQRIVESSIVACVRCSGILASKQVSYVFSKLSRYAVFWFGNCIEWAFEITQCFGGGVVRFR